MFMSSTVSSLVYFNSQPHEEADNHVWWIIGLAKYFNSQPHEEADDRRPFTFSDQVCISTHSLTRRLTAILNKNNFI